MFVHVVFHLQRIYHRRILGLMQNCFLAIQAAMMREVGWLLCQCLTLEWYLHKNTLGLEPKKETFGYCHTLRNCQPLFSESAQNEKDLTLTRKTLLLNKYILGNWLSNGIQLGFNLYKLYVFFKKNWIYFLAKYVENQKGRSK